MLTLEPFLIRVTSLIKHRNRFFFVTKSLLQAAQTQGKFFVKDRTNLTSFAVTFVLG